MADFITDLWGSIFTPGATPTLLLATNATFACLQLVLAGLLAATYSIHFFILSVLCGGLWAAINWFARELQEAQAKEAEAERIRKLQQQQRSGAKNESGDTADDEETETEMESLISRNKKAESEYVPTGKDEQIRQEILDQYKKGPVPLAKGTGLAPAAAASARQRGPSRDMSASEVSTDSEWEKVESER